MIFMFRDMIFVGAKQHRDKGLIIPKLFLQAGTILSGVWVITGMLPLLIEIDKTNLLASLGAVTAIILLVFKDYIQGFVSGVYLLSEKLISQNDVITLPSQGLSGKIVEIGMRAIKLENEDKNIIIVPTYELSRSNFIKVSPENQIQ